MSDLIRRSYPTFELWLESVNRMLLAMCGIESDGLPDWGYADAYAAGVSPRTAANRVISAAKEY